jgi:hypothetical protein
VLLDTVRHVELAVNFISEVRQCILFFRAQYRRIFSEGLGATLSYAATVRGEPNPMTDNEEKMTVWLTAMEAFWVNMPPVRLGHSDLANVSSYLRIR